MELIILTIHLMIALSLIIVVLLQRSEGGGLGIGGGGGGGGGLGSLMSARGTANLLTRTTAILAACFMGTSITLAILASQTTSSSIIDRAPVVETAPEPAAPAAPLSQ